MGKDTILVIDDDEQIRESLGQYLELLGHRVKSAPDAQAALQHVRQGVDLVLTDQRLPATSGLELIREIRKLNLQVPFVLMTGFPDIGTVQEARGLGVSAFLKKPLDLKDLGHRVDDLLGKPDTDRFYGTILVLSKGLADTMEEKLTWGETYIYEGEEEANQGLEAIHREKPVAILGDVKSPFTLSLLDEYRRRKQDQAAFLIAGDESDLDLITEALFKRKADGAVTVGDTADNIKAHIVDCVKRLEGGKEKQRRTKDTLIERCMYARSFQRGRYCTYQGPCASREGWVVINGVDHQKCGKKPLQFGDWNQVGLYIWPHGVVTLEKVHDARREVIAMIKLGKKAIVFDLTSVKELHVNLLETLADLYEELMTTYHDGVMTVINLDQQLDSEFREFSQTQGIRLVL
ncbi:response regulator [Candidatus Methylomirabilis sp.]|uniref:response regulator n=1 Tax=Candidatus Methylomirabilis sp. TaxID=2032687 RepID=UPI002A5FD2EC|nr:response regulator [Candidatus Methylomirabilis sp.]